MATMNDQHSNTVSPSRPRWTEDRVERLLMALFAEQPLQFTNPAKSVTPGRGQRGIVIAVVAACLATMIPLLSAPVDENGDANKTAMARWIGPPVRAQEPKIDLASSEDVELASDESSSASESDETAEAPSTPETEDSAST
jgi:hypothetical protein